MEEMGPSQRRIFVDHQHTPLLPLYKERGILIDEGLIVDDGPKYSPQGVGVETRQKELPLIAVYTH